MADETVKDPVVKDPTVGSQTGQTAADSQVTKTETSQVIPIEDYKNLQSFATKTSQELKAIREEAAKKDQEYAATSVRARELEEKFNRLGQAFGNAAPTEPQLSPEQIAELDKYFQQTPTYRTLAEQTKTQQQAQQQALQQQHTMAVNEAAVVMEQRYKLDANSGEQLKGFIIAKPYLLAGVQNATTKEQALDAFETAIKAMNYDNLNKNAVALGTEQVEQKLKAMEATTSVDQGTRSAGATNAAEVQYKRGFGLDGPNWDAIKAKVLQEHGG